MTIFIAVAASMQDSRLNHDG